MNVVGMEDWREFKQRLDGYAQQPRLRRQQLLFRGQGNANWPLNTTLDRKWSLRSDDERQLFYARLLDDFRREATRIGFTDVGNLMGDALELLARHHGLPTPLIDWTESPYIAAFFALSDPEAIIAQPAAVWVLDRALFTSNPSDVELIDDDRLLRFNKRALQQRGIFTRVATIRQPVEALLDAALTKFVLPTINLTQALADLDSMTLNAASLFYDLDGAARTAVMRAII
jgi:FRG domain